MLKPQRFALVAVLGYVASLLLALTQDPVLGEARLLWMPALILLGGVLVVAATREWRVLTRSWAWALVPCGCMQLLAVFFLIVPVETLPFINVGPKISLEVGGIDLSLFRITLWKLLMLAMAMWAVLWNSHIVLHVVRHPGLPRPFRSALVPAWHETKRTWRRGSVAVIVGWVGAAGLPLLCLPLMEWGPLFVFLPVVPWSLATAGLLPWVLMSKEPLWKALLSGVRCGGRGAWRWALPVLLHLAVLGQIVFLQFRGSTGSGEEVRSQLEVSFRWPGGFPVESEWLVNYLAFLGAPSPEFLSALLAVALFLVAVAVRLRVTRIVLEIAQGDSPSVGQDSGSPVPPLANTVEP